MKDKKPTKLFSWREGIVIGIGVCGGVTLFIYRSYTRKGYIDKVEIGSMIFAMLMCIGICVGVAWWGNRPEKED